jgi:5-methyltetrahydrofolate--homocysteine methyltransferase
MSRLLEALHSGRVLLMDGAMGTELQRAGIGEGESYESWNLTHPEQVRAIHRAYVDAGAEVSLTNTFQSNPDALHRYGVAREMFQGYNAAALEIARSVSPRGGFVLGDIGPWSGSLLPEKSAVVRSLAEADGILLETFSDLAAVGDAYWMSEQTGHRVPILLSLSYHRDTLGRLVTQSGHEPEVLARHAVAGRVAALGVNCGKDIGLDEIIEIVRRYRSVTDLPLFARPNAGTPTREGERRIYPLTPHAMAGRLSELLDAGVSMVGGCCGTTPEHIAACRPINEAWNARL